MTELYEEKKAQYAVRARQALLECGLSEIQVEKVLPRIIASTLFFKGRLSEQSAFWNFHSKLTKTAKLLGISESRYMEAAIQEPVLFFRLPEKINRSIEETAQLLGIRKSQYLGAALKYPVLFYQRPSSVHSRVKEAARLLNIDTAQYVEAALVLPELFYRSPQAINKNVRGAARLLKISKARYIGAALMQPQIFCQLPERIYYNIEAGAQAVGVSRTRYIEAALQHPPLFSQLPETIGNHARLMRLFNVRGLIIPDVAEKFMIRPRLLSMADDNFYLRLVFAQLADRKAEKKFGLLSRDRKYVERRVVEYLGHDPDQKTVERKGGFKVHKRNHQLVRMIETGLIKEYN